MYRSVLALVVMGVVAGCTTTGQTPTRKSSSSKSIQYPNSPDVGVAHYDLALGGAAWRAPGNRHVIGADKPTYAVTSTSGGSDKGQSGEPRSSASESDDPSSSSSDEAGQQRSREARRARALWRQFCDPTTTLSDKESKAFQRLRRDHSMPQELNDECAPRK